MKNDKASKLSSALPFPTRFRTLWTISSARVTMRKER